MNTMGIETGWRMIQGTPAFFNSTKKFHNMLQGEPVEIAQEDKSIYEQVVFENSTRLHLDAPDAVIVHDPQPLALIEQFNERAQPWIWQCHLDMSNPHPPLWNYLSRFVSEYDAAIFSLPEYRQQLGIDQRFITPAINPFSDKNRELTEQEISQCLAYHRIPIDRPIITQISRFDRWKDPVGVIEAVRKVQQQIDCTLVLLGNNALDDPEANVIIETIQSSVDERIIVLTVDDPILVNALQRRAAVVVQKSLREGFGLTVTEAMWKGAAVVGGNVGGIRSQITDGVNGFLVDSVEQTSDRILMLLQNPGLRAQFGANAKATVLQRYLLSHLIEEWLDLLPEFIDDRMDN